MKDEEKYLFDLQGYLVVPDVLGPDELTALNGLLDGHGLWEHRNPLGFGAVKRYGDHLINAGPLHFVDRPARSVIAHPRLVPYAVELLGEDFRYDEGQVLFARDGAGALILHNGNTPWEYPPLTYQVRGSRIYAGHLIAAFCLTDALEEHGGFAAVPGSHKANFECPRRFRAWQETGPWLSRVPVRAGAMVLFADTATHGSWPWRADFERRVVFCRYTAGMVQHTAPAPLAEETPFDDWTPVERRILRAPFAWRFGQDENGYAESQRTSVVSGEGYVMTTHTRQIMNLG